jgi:predicted MFS family arabinose efflux permease
VLDAGIPGILAAAILLGGTIMGLTALGLIQARKLARGDPRQSLALMTAAFGLGQMIGPSFAGFAFHYTGSFRAPSLAAALALVVAAALVGLPLRRHRL